MTVTGQPDVIPDRYPTRVGDRTGPIDRTDPTVWSDGADGPIDAATLAAYDADGYTVVEGLLSPAEVRAYWEELVRLSGDETLLGTDRVVLDDRSGAVRTIFDAHRVSDLIAELVCDPRVLDRARQILGSEVYVHQSRLTYLPGFRGEGSFWHSDFETWHVEDGMPAPRALAVSIALTDEFAVGGGLLVMPGSHRTFVPCADAGIPEEAELTTMAAEHGIDQFTGPAGSALLADANLMYGAGNNITPYPRSSIVIVFNSVANPLVDPFGAGPPRPAHLAARDFTPACR